MKVSKKSVDLFNSGDYSMIPMDEIHEIVKSHFPELEHDILGRGVFSSASFFQKHLVKIFKGRKI